MLTVFLKLITMKYELMTGCSKSVLMFVERNDFVAVSGGLSFPWT